MDNNHKQTLKQTRGAIVNINPWIVFITERDPHNLILQLLFSTTGFCLSPLKHLFARVKDEA